MTQETVQDEIIVTGLKYGREAQSCGTAFQRPRNIIFARKRKRRYASVVCFGPVSVCLSVCLSQVGVLLKRLKCKQKHRTIAQEFYFSVAKDFREIRPGSTPVGAPNAGGVGQNRRILTDNWIYLENGTR